MEKFRGLFCALLTPFTKDNKINENALCNMVESALNSGVCGFLVGGSVSEYFLLDDAERAMLYDIVASAAKGRATLVAHISSTQSDTAVKYGKYALSKGYDALCTAPFCRKSELTGIKSYYKNIAKIGLPTIIYNFSSDSNIHMSIDTMFGLLENEEFIGVRTGLYSSDSVTLFRSLFPEKLIYNSFDVMYTSDMINRADGGISTSYNYMADKFAKINRLVQIGDCFGANAIQDEINRIVYYVSVFGKVAAERDIISMRGIDIGNIRRPYLAPDTWQRIGTRNCIMPLINKFDFKFV